MNRRLSLGTGERFSLVINKVLCAYFSRCWMLKKEATVKAIYLRLASRYNYSLFKVLPDITCARS